MIKVDQVLVGGEVAVEDMHGIVDTGTSLMVGGSDVVGAMTKLQVDQSCKGVEELPDITFVIGGKQ